MAALLTVGVAPWATAIDTNVSGRVTFGSVYRVQDRDPNLLTTVNAAAIGLAGYGSGGNADDANTNYGKWDAASTALKAYLDLSAREGNFAALVRIKAWRDFGLLDDRRPWGNVASRYAGGEPLSDAGAPRLSRFSGIALSEAWIQHSVQFGSMRLTARLGQQNLNWGDRSGIGGGLEALNPKDLPALRRAGAVPQEMRVPVPMLFGRLEVTPGVGIEAYYQGRFRPTAVDMCGTLWSMSDYLVDGCDRVMSGQPQVSDRARQPLGAYQKRLPTPKPEAAEFGLGLTWKMTPSTDIGLYHARYNARTMMPGVRRSMRNGASLIPGDPDGLNMAYFTDYAEGLRLSALTFAHKRGATTFFGEASYRPRLPFMLSPGDVLPPFLNPTAPALLRARADAVPPGGLLRGYDLHKLAQAQLGVQREFKAGSVPLLVTAEVVAKHTADLPNQAVLRYNRADIFGVGPVNGNCNVTTRDAARQCSLRGYATADSYAYRLRLDARFAALLPGLNASASAVFAHDVKGWSGDFLINEGRKTMNLALRFEYLQRYLAEIGYQPNWGGDYNPAVDRDTVGLAVGVRF